MVLRELPSIRQLRAFIAVYRTGQLSAAAEMLSVSQPAVSVLIRELEQKLGVRLFERTTRALRRTEAADETIVFAERALAELSAMGRAANDLAGTKRGRLRIAVTSTTAQTLFPLLWKRYSNLYPQIGLTLEDCAPNEFVEKIASDRVDLGIGTLEAAIPGLEERVFLKDTLVAVAVTASSFPKGVDLNWRQLSELPVVVVKPGYGVRQRIELAALQAGVTLRVEHEVSLLATALAMAAAGLGVAIVPGTVVQHSQYRQLALRPLVDPVVERDVAVIFKRDRELPPAAVSLTQMLTDGPADPVSPRRP